MFIRSDVWSLGCVMYEVITLQPPFRADDMEALYRRVLRGQYNPLPQNFSKDLAHTIAMLLQVNPRQRPTIAQLLQYNRLLF